MKLSQEDAAEITMRAKWESGLGGGRWYAQILWGYMPEELRKSYIGTSKDFFFMNEDAANVCFYEFYVRDDE